MRRIKRVRWAVAVCAAIGCCLLLWLLTPADRSLLKRAHIVEPRKDFIFPLVARLALPPLRLQGDWPYCWVSSRDLLTAHFSDASILALKPRLEELPTGRQLPVSRLTQAALGSLLSIRVSKQQAYVDLGVSFQGSPDGAWILASSISSRGLTRGALQTVIRADDSSQVDWRLVDGVESSSWMRDSRHWVGLMRERGKYRVGLFDLDQPSGANEHILDMQKRADWTGPRGIAPTLAGVLHDGRVLAIHWSEPANGQVLTARFFPDAEVEHPHKQRIPIPAGREAVPLLPPVLSPGGDRIAWFVTVRRTPLGWPATRRLWSLFKTAPSVQIGLWTTRADGVDPEEIGVIAQHDPDDRPSLLQWTPDGRSLSFRYQGALYSVPAK